jgi:DNA sulfur modification protein DndE
VKRIDAPTRWVLIQPRVHVAGRDDLPATKAVLDAITVEGLAEAGGTKAPAAPANYYAAPEFSDAKLPVSALAFKDPLQFWEILAEALIENPPPLDQISALLPLFEPLGIVPGKPWDRSKIDPVVAEAMAKVAKGLGTTLALLPGAAFRNGWRPSAPTIGDFGADYLTRARTARNGLTANTPREAIYIGGFAGSDGKPLSGSNRYAVSFKVLPPFAEPGFWSLTLYNSANNYTIPNPINRHALGSDDKTLKLNADGSLTIYLQKDSPGPAKEANWLPAPAGQYYLILRAYAPGEALLRSQTESDDFPLPPIELVE